MSSFNLKSMLGQLPWSRPQGKEQKPAREPGSHYEHHLGQGAPQAEGFNNGVEKSSPMLQQYRHVALYFKSGAPLLLPVTAEQCEALTKCMQKPFVGLATYDNRFVVVRTSAIVEMFVWDETYGAPHPREGFPDCLGELPHSDTFWHIIEHAGKLDALDEAIDAHMIETAQAVLSGYARAESAVPQDAVVARSQTYCWQQSATGALRSVADEGGCSNEELWAYLGANLNDTSVTSSARGTLPKWINIPIHLSRLRVTINTEQIDYLWMPLHKFREGRKIWESEK